MRFKLNVIIPAFAFFVLFSSYTPKDKVLDKNEVLLKLIMQSLNQGHYQSQIIDNDFSTKVFNHYLQQIDGSKKYLTSKDIEKLGAFKTEIDEQINKGTYEFFKLSEKLMSKRIQEAGVYADEILSKPFDFSKDESIEFDDTKRSYAEGEEAVKEVWRKFLKYRTLFILEDLISKEDEKAKTDKSFKRTPFEELEKKARESVRKSQKEQQNGMAKIDESDWLSIYLNSITTIYDPHTAYFPPEDKENFDIAMSGQLEGIGARLSSKGGYIVVAEIVPGSACWRQGKLKAGDKILKVGQGSEEPIDVTDMRADHAVKYIRGKKGTEVRLTVQQVDGNIITIPIIRDIVVLEETYAKSAVINNQGYINLPKFYADFTGNGGRDCSDDVKNEIEKLKAEGVEGIILDLRNNGGGSLQDVVEMAGLFIKEGPIVQVKAKVGKPRVYSDTDENIYYDGPLVVMVNTYSASASEILAAAMQDYGRAVIVGGSPTTFGKGTVQRAFDLDGFVSEAYNEIKPLGALKLTLQKFYRIDGGATQLKGVTPDVILPDTWSYLNVGEKDQEFPIPWDEIGPLQYDQWGNSVTTQLGGIQQKSAERIRKNEIFKLIDENAKRYKIQQEDTKYPLSIEKYQAKISRINEESRKYDDMLQKLDDMQVSFLKADISKINADEVTKEKMERWKQNLEKDVYINEAIAILDDIK
ncbi:carboxy terminal-processing peptidase [Fulvivirgaceae bacterium BMA12]|uniref:Carboxy terminal-processing peptidase n=1 Tax=Agaribacillus aureus TaxID=3051825 RepID=A0ABT8LHV5_9BACT|nr:carboxy terminal-processing peptidase [Fulvivirgaceae bacterium BMA12]